MIEWDTGFNVRAWNPGAACIFGYSADEMRGRHVTRLVSELELSNMTQFMGRLGAGEKDIRLRTLNRRKDGALVTCDWVNTCLQDTQGRVTGYASLVHDVSELLAGETVADGEHLAAPRKTEACLRLVNTLTKQLYGVVDVDSIARCTVDTIAALDDTKQIAFYVHEEENDRLRLVEHNGFDTETVRKGAFLPLNGSLSGLAVREQKVQISEDLSQDRRLEPAVQSLLVTSGMCSGAVIPLVCDAKVLGTLNLVYASPREFDKADRSTLMSVGRSIGLSMSNAIHLASLRYQAQHDALTGLPNRAFLQLECERMNRDVGEPHNHVALILFDIDHFKEINDTLGHHVGDRLLISIGERVTAALQSRDLMFCRLGGDEFALVRLLDDGREQVGQVVRELLGVLEEPFMLEGLALGVSSSAGVAICPEHAVDSQELLRCADVAMYQAKRHGTRFEIYDPVFDEYSPERLSLTAELAQGIREGQLVLYYQPKINLADNRISAFEALVRWQHPRQGLLGPDQFIGFAEMSETIHALTNWVIDTALAQLRHWQECGYDLGVSINISTRNLVDQAFPGTLRKLIEKHGVEPGRVELEITESSLISRPERTQASLRQIANLGVMLSIDDFGTGYSSLSYLKRLPVNTIKIDRTFVTDMLADQQDLVIVRSTINMARSLGLQVVAEGAEDRATYDTLRGMGCDYVQGHYTGAPMEACAVEARLKT